VGNVAERGPLIIVGAPRQHSEKVYKQKCIRSGFPYTVPKPEITRKQQQSKNFRKTRKTTTY